MIIYGRFFPATKFFWFRMYFYWFCNRSHFLSYNKNFMKIFVHIIWVLQHSDYKFESKNQFFKKFKNCPKLRVWPEFSDDFGQFLNCLKNWFSLSNLKSECCNTQIICTQIFIKFLLQDKKWERLQNQQKYILQQKKSCGWEEPAMHKAT